LIDPEILLPSDVERVYREKYNRFDIYVIGGKPFQPIENGAHPTVVVLTKYGDLALVPYS